jgi:uncharacterized protein YecE (DUF72 family)
MSFDRERMKTALAALAQQGVFVGTSSWKYSGWMGQLYEQDRYIYRGRFSESRFEKLCLTEYAEVFKSVCVDAAYYNFPDHRYLEGMAAQVPQDFQFAFKVTDQITIKRFPNFPRFGIRAGKLNDNFLNADLFASAFVEPCQPFRRKVGLLMFEFSKFYSADFERGRDFVEALDHFLGRLPKGWPYSVELRNRNFLQEDYFATLARHGVSHIYNSWQEMPSLAEQIAIPGSRTTPDFFGARLLLKPGRKYEDAVKLFKPYNEIKDPYPDGRSAGAQLVKSAAASGGRTRGYIYVNNRFEGNALQTIAAILE